MAEVTKVELTKDNLDLNGVQVTFTVHIGDWVKRVSISPIDYKVFKKWDEIYASRVVESIVKDIEYHLKESQNDK